MAQTLKIKKKTDIPPSEELFEEDKNETVNQIMSLFVTLDPRIKLKIMGKMGVGDKYFTCQRCGKVKLKDRFYPTTTKGIASQITCVCKDCALDIAMPIKNGIRIEPTRESIDEAIRVLDKPFLETAWDSAVIETASKRVSTENNMFTAYMKEVNSTETRDLTYKDSDNYTGGMFSLVATHEEDTPKNQEILDQFEKNKEDTLRLLGYLPFEKEKVTDQPFLYAQLLGFLDSSEQGNDDMMRVSSIISIVRGFLQQSQIDDRIAEIMNDPVHLSKNMQLYKSLEEAKKSLTLSITKLAEQSCISLKHSRNATKGENTWTGKIKKIKDLNLREGELNGFDIETSKAMRQVMDMSNASILQQLKLDESEYSDIIADQREYITKLQEELDAYAEISRILLRENLDIKDKLKNEGINLDFRYCNLEELFSPFMGLMAGEEDIDIANEDWSLSQTSGEEYVDDI